MIGQDGTDTQVSDAELFASTTLDREPEPQAQIAETAEPSINRDEQGRFAAKAPEAEGQQVAGAKPEEGERAAAHVPSSRLREEAEARRNAEARAIAAEAELQRLRQPQQQAEPDAPPAVWDNPDLWGQSLVDPVQRSLRETREFYSMRDAQREHGPDKVRAALVALDTAIAEGRLSQADVEAHRVKTFDFVGDIMKWHGEQVLRAEIGNDPEAYKKKIIEEYLASQGQQQAPAPGQQPAATSVVKLPPRLNRTTSAASSDAGGGDDGMSDAALFASTTARR